MCMPTAAFIGRLATVKNEETAPLGVERLARNVVAADADVFAKTDLGLSRA